MQDRNLTSKGARQAEAVLDAAIRCLGTDGYAATSLQRVADEAGIQKRMVLYYFDSREHLIASAFGRVAERFHQQLRERLDGLHEPTAIVDALVDLVLQQAEDRGLVAAYFGLVAEAATDPTLRRALDAVREREIAYAHEVLDRVEAAGHELSMDRELLILTALTAGHGLGIELLLHGGTPQLERAIALARAAVPIWLFD